MQEVLLDKFTKWFEKTHPGVMYSVKEILGVGLVIVPQNGDIVPYSDYYNDQLTGKYSARKRTKPQ